MLASLLVLIRPLDFASAALTYVYIGVRTLYSAHKRDEAIVSWKHTRLAAALAFGTALGPFVYMAFSLRAYGSAIPLYFQIVHDSGYSFATIPQKFVSLFVDSDALYLVPKNTFLAYFPWLLVTISMIPIVLVSAPNNLKLICVLACVHFALYFAYADLGPDNLFLYKITHYFKVWMPYFGLIAVVGLIEMVRARHSIFTTLAVVTGLVMALLVTCLGFDLLQQPIKATVVAGERSITIEPSDGGTATLDFVDLSSIGSPIPIKYAIGNNKITVDGVKLRRLADVRLGYSPPGHSPVISRILFMRPITFKKVFIALDETFIFSNNARLYGFTYGFALKRPYWFR